MSKILFVTSEAFPLVKTGGLGDVGGSLPAALLKQSQDVRLLLPAYPEVLDRTRRRKILAVTSYYTLPVEIIETRLPDSNVIVWLVDCPAAYDRPGGPYTDKSGLEWHDNSLRFAIFCQAAVDIALDRLELDWQPDVVHCNDWQTGLVPALLSLYTERPATVFTIHNLAYQGIFDQQTFLDLHLPAELWHMNGLEYHGQLSFIKGGLAYADKINTVSPTYAREILDPEFGYGLDGLLKHRADHLSGILNGIDEKHWNPGTDKHLAQKYNRKTLGKKALNKTALQRELSLPEDISTPMIGMVSRLIEQKGVGIILQSLPKLLTMPVQLVILGTGDPHYVIELSEWAQRHPERLTVTIGFDESLAHRIVAASDIYLMPSTFEPCGLSQLYSLRYGTLPVVSNVGGLADTVIDASDENMTGGTANGFVLKQISAAALLDTMQLALALYRKPEKWRKLQLTAMSGDFSWQRSAERYIALYRQALKER
jgi:starch synthase